jgi:DNA-binding PadR family transcriptional regulator
MHDTTHTGHAGHHHQSDSTDRHWHGERHPRFRAGRRGHGEGMEPGRGAGRGRGRRHGGRPGRTQRGDVRAATLLLLGEGPMHGYQLMQEIERRTDGAWRPSPGAVYPTISLLEDEGYVEITREGSRQLVTLTDTGRAYLEEQRESFGDPFTGRVRGGASDLRDLLEGLQHAVFQVARDGDEAQIESTRTALASTRRAIYLILAGDDTGQDDTGQEGPNS